MARSSEAALRTADQPFDAHTATRTLALTTTDTSVELPAGVYETFAECSAVTAMRLGNSTAALPSATETAGLWVVPPNGAVTFVLGATTTVHARCTSGTGTLYLTRKGLS